MRCFPLACLLGLLVIAGCTPNASPNRKALPETTGAAPTMRDQGSAPAPDNTAVNRRDMDSSAKAKTPFDQSESTDDIEITAKIRQRVVDLPEMSVNARNVKIITIAGKVTLRGPVNSADEREVIGQIAKDVAGEQNVDNQLEVADQ